MFREGHKHPQGGIILGGLLKSESGPEMTTMTGMSGDHALLHQPEANSLSPDSWMLIRMPVY